MKSPSSLPADVEAGRVSIHLVPTPVLRQRHRDLELARRRLDLELERLRAALEARAPKGGKRAPKVPKAPSRAKHGTPSGYHTHLNRWKTPPCTPCKRAHAQQMARYRAAARARKAAKAAES